MDGSEKYILSQDQLNQIAAIASRAGVKAYKDEQAKNEKKKSRNEDKVRRTKKMLSCGGVLLRILWEIPMS